MRLVEFFSRPIDINQNQKNKDQVENFDDELFWFMLDNDRLHKEHFFPISKKIKSLSECGDQQIFELFMPMVVGGCKNFYKDKKMSGRMNKKFPQEMREGICKRLYDHYCENYGLKK
jgi:hypothetical protein